MICPVCQVALRQVSKRGILQRYCNPCNREKQREWRRSKGVFPKVARGRQVDQVTDRTCECGCGSFVKYGKRFVGYHHLRVVKKSAAHCANLSRARRAYEASRTPTDRVQSIFDRKVITQGGCWEPPGRNHNGGGYCSVKQWDGRVLYLHRESYARHVGPLVKGLQVDHLCNNRRCFNPEHLEQVTPAENNRRKLERASLPKAS